MQVPDGEGGHRDVDGSDFNRWRRLLGEGDGLPYLDQLLVWNTAIILRGEYLKILEGYRDCQVRLGLVQDPLNVLFGLVESYREWGFLPVELVVSVVEGLRADFRELNEKKVDG